MSDKKGITKYSGAARKQSVSGGGKGVSLFVKIKLRDQFISLFVIVLAAMSFIGVAGVYSLSNANGRWLRLS